MKKQLHPIEMIHDQAADSWEISPCLLYLIATAVLRMVIFNLEIGSKSSLPNYKLERGDGVEFAEIRYIESILSP